MKRAAATELPLHVLGALAILRRYNASLPGLLRFRTRAFTAHLESMYREPRRRLPPAARRRR